MTLIEEFIEKYNSLIIFLRFSRDEIYNKVPDNFLLWGVESEKQTKINYLNYKEQIISSSIILGCSYFEVYLQDIIRLYHKKYPGSLPDNKKLEYRIIKTVNDYDTLIEELIKIEIHEQFYKGIKEILSSMNREKGFSIDENNIEKIEEAFLIRNCIIHNHSKVDKRLGAKGKFRINEKIILEESLVHDAGIVIREVARKLYEECLKKNIIEEETNTV